mgnify:CR=1 FL=1
MNRLTMPKDFLWVLDRLRENDPEGEFIFSERGKRLTQNCIRQRQK